MIGWVAWLFVLTYNMIFLFVQPLNKLPVKKVCFSFKISFKCLDVFLWHSVWHEEICFTKAADSRMGMKKWLPSVLPCAENLFQEIFFLPAFSFIALTKKKSRYPDF